MVQRAGRSIARIGMGVLALLLAGCGGSGGGVAQSQLSVIPRVVAEPALANRLTGNLERWLTQTVAQPDVVSATLLFDVPREQFRYAGAQGLANPQAGEALTTAYPFRVASISKVFTATVVLQLVEEGYFSLDTPLSRLLDNALLPPGYTLDDLHVINGVKSGGSITVRQLLQHTAGLRDYVAPRYKCESFAL